MTFWSQERLTQEVLQVTLVDPYDAANLENGAYALGVAAEYAVTTPDGGGEKKIAAKGEQITIPPGQFALLLTDERVTVPTTAIGFISMKARWKLRGLINVSGFHVDPGFTGRLKFSVYNAGNQSLSLEPNERVFVIWYSSLDQKTAYGYRGRHQGQTGITSDDVSSIRGMVGSPAGLNARIHSLDGRITTELGQLKSDLLLKMSEEGGRLRQDFSKSDVRMSDEAAKLRQDFAKVEISQGKIERNQTLLIGLLVVLTVGAILKPALDVWLARSRPSATGDGGVP